MDVSTGHTDLHHKILESYDGFESRLNGEAKSQLHGKRREALEVFRKAGFPTVKHEDWKYTSFEAYLKEDWADAQAPEPGSISYEDIEKYIPQGLEAHLLVFAGGHIVEELSHIRPGEDEAIIISSFGKAIKSHAPLLDKYFGQVANTAKNGWVAVNTAYARQGAFIYVPKGKALKCPVHLLYLNGTEQDNQFVQLRNLLVLDENAEGTVIETTASLGRGSSLCNIVTEASVERAARLTHYKLQLEDLEAGQVNYTQVKQQQDSFCKNVTVTLGGKVVRNDLDYLLNDKGCEAQLHGLYITRGSQHVDNHSYADHAMPNCYSNEYYKGIMMDESRGVFNGKIMVRQDAQKTNAYQSNKNILLSNNASIDTKPQLEIFADDVKCSHGATTGQLDEEAMFYLRSRGIGKEEAKAILTYAFAEDVLDTVPEGPLKVYLDRLLEDKLNNR